MVVGNSKHSHVFNFAILLKSRKFDAHEIYVFSMMIIMMLLVPDLQSDRIEFGLVSVWPHVSEYFLWSSCQYRLSCRLVVTEHFSALLDTDERLITRLNPTAAGTAVYSSENSKSDERLAWLFGAEKPTDWWNPVAAAHYRSTLKHIIEWLFSPLCHRQPGRLLSLGCRLSLKPGEVTASTTQTRTCEALETRMQPAAATGNDAVYRSRGHRSVSLRVTSHVMYMIILITTKSM